MCFTQNTKILQMKGNDNRLGNLNPQEKMKSGRNGKYVGKYKGLCPWVYFRRHDCTKT